MSIIMHTGRPGTGKTYNLVRRGLRHLRKGRTVYSNIKINYEGENLKFWKNVEDLRNIKEGIILMDEAHVYFNSRKWKDLPEETLRLLAQHRKKGLHIEGTVQHVNRLDVVMRELIDHWYTYENKPFFFIRWEFDIDQDKQKKWPLSRRYILKRKKIYNAYDTLETVEL